MSKLIPQGKPSVLIVDDEPQVLIALEDVLSDEYTVLVADSGARALELLCAQRDVAVVVTDQRMPAMSGDELLARIGETSRAVSILLTGFADLSAVVRAVNEGRLFAYATKPWDREDLRLKVSKAVEHYQLTCALLRERQLLHDLMNSTPDAVYFKDRDLRFVRANSACARYFRAPMDELRGKRLTQCGVLPEEAERMELDERRVVESGMAVRDSLSQLATERGSRWLSTTRAPVQGSDGSVTGIVAISRDVTERIEAVNRLEAQTALLNSVLDCMGDGVVAVGTDGEVLLSNQRAERLIGAHVLREHPSLWPDALGMYLPDRATPLPDSDNVLVLAMSGAPRREVEVYLKAGPNPGVSLAITATALQSTDGTLIGGIALLRDVTQHRRLEQQLSQSQKMEAIGVLAGGIAHDFNNLLSVIASYCTFALEELGPQHPIREEITAIVEAGRRASALTRQLLAFSRKGIAQPKVLDLNGVVLDSEKLLGRILGEDISLKSELGAPLGGVRADANQVEQVILNLAVNARDAMPSGGRLAIATCDVEVGPESSLPPGSYVMLSVSDSGVGMAPEVQQRIFEPFFTTKQPGLGTGLGLSTVYGIVRQAGGHVQVHSEPGCGTRFEILFPRVEGEGHLRRSPSMGAAVMADEQATILLVEDDHEVRRAAARILNRCGYCVIDTGSPAEARAVCAERGEAIDLLLTDVVMPELSGPSLAKELSASCPKLKTLFMSGYPGGTTLRGESFDEEAPYLPKPFTPASLSAKVREVLRGRA
ncbi:MAG: response regulator [Myxococcales bacterium]|nr:response regulator [Myxococcales bacterium]MCB9578319.1 response regulator [Polyangiaceae bacterium]